MSETAPTAAPPRPSGGLGGLLAPYRGAIAGLVVLTIAGNALNLLIPRLVADAIDSYGRDAIGAAGGRAHAPAGRPRHLRLRLPPERRPDLCLRAGGARSADAADRPKIAAQDHAYIQQVTPAALLTHLTSDVDAVKMFVAQAIASLISSVFLIIGASVLLLAIDWRLALAVLAVLPIVGVHVLVVLRPGPHALQARRRRRSTG